MASPWSALASCIQLPGEDLNQVRLGLCSQPTWRRSKSLLPLSLVLGSAPSTPTMVAHCVTLAGPLVPTWGSEHYSVGVREGVGVRFGPDQQPEDSRVPPHRGQPPCWRPGQNNQAGRVCSSSQPSWGRGTSSPVLRLGLGHKPSAPASQALDRPRADHCPTWSSAWPPCQCEPLPHQMAPSACASYGSQSDNPATPAHRPPR